MRHVFNAIFFCLFAVLVLKVNAQTLNQGVNWDSALSSCSRERDISDDLAAKARPLNYGHRDSKEIIDDTKRWYPSESQLIDRLEKAILHYQGEVERYKAAVDLVRNDKNFYLPTAANLANSELYLCLFRAGLRQVRQSASPSNTQHQATVRRENQEDGARVDVNQSIALAQQNQAEAEEKRKKDGRRRNRPDLVASDCLTPDTGPRDHGFSVFKNSCSEPVEYTYCTVGAQEGSLAAFVSCTNRHGNKGGGSGSVRAGGESAAPMRGASEVHWLACKRPARAITRGFENGKLVGDCIDLGA